MPKEKCEAANLAGSSSAAEQYMASEAKPALSKHGYGRFAPPHQADGFSAAQFHANADTEAELDADTALVHFSHDEQGRQAQDNCKQQRFQDRFHPEELQQMPERSTQSIVAELNHLNSFAGPHAATGVPDWQVQQAAEVCLGFLTTSNKLQSFCLSQLLQCSEAAQPAPCKKCAW